MQVAYGPSAVTALLSSLLTAAAAALHSKPKVSIRSSPPHDSSLSPVQFGFAFMHSASGRALASAVLRAEVLPHAQRSVADLCFAARDATSTPAIVAFVKCPAHLDPVQFHAKAHSAAHPSSERRSESRPARVMLGSVRLRPVVLKQRRGAALMLHARRGGGGGAGTGGGPRSETAVITSSLSK